MGATGMVINLTAAKFSKKILKHCITMASSYREQLKVVSEQYGTYVKVKSSNLY